MDGDFVALVDAARSVGCSRKTASVRVRRAGIETFRAAGDRRIVAIRRVDYETLFGPEPIRRETPQRAAA